MKKITKIHVGREFYLSWNSNCLVVGRPRSNRHLTITTNGRRLVAHLTNEGSPKQHRHLAAIHLDKLHALVEKMATACGDAFIDGLIPIDAALLAEHELKVSAFRNYGLEFARTFFKPRLRSVLAIREPSKQRVAGLGRRYLDTLLDPSHLDSLRDQPPGSVSAVYMDDGEVIGAFQLFYYPDGAVRSDGTTLDPGWYGLLHQEYMNSAYARVLLEVAGPSLFSKVEHALRFLGFKSRVSAVEMEDAFRRLAGGESIEDVRARIHRPRATVEAS